MFIELVGISLQVYSGVIYSDVIIDQYSFVVWALDLYIQACKSS